jgi:hypothetical protein
MIADYTDVVKKREYEYKNLLVADKGLEEWQLVKKWDNGFEIKKDDSAISILLRRKMKGSE